MESTSPHIHILFLPTGLTQLQLQIKFKSILVRFYWDLLIGILSNLNMEDRHQPIILYLHYMSHQ